MGRSFAELDLLFEQGVSARKFASTKVDVFAENVEGRVLSNYQKQVNYDHIEGLRTQA